MKQYIKNLKFMCSENNKHVKKYNDQNIANFIFKVLFLSLCIIANTHFAYAQTASILPQGKTQFLDNNGKPLASGTVDFYVPSTTTRKTTWQNSGETVANTNPVVLDAGGRGIIYGDGNYRMVVKDRLGNLIYDQLTSSTGSGGSTPSTATGDGDLVGTVKPWAGMVAPSQYLFTYGQEVSRTTYSALYTAITSTQPVFCNSGSPTLSGVGDTTNFWVGMSVEVSCVPAGFSTIVSKTASSVTLAANSNVSTNTNAIFYPWGRGNGTTTFNLPDFRGYALAGNNNMGGVASSRLTSTYFATNPNSSGGAAGNQINTLTAANVPSIFTTNLNTIAVTVTGTVPFSSSTSYTNTFAGGAQPIVQSTTPANITASGVAAINALGTSNTYTNSGGIAIASSVAAGGSGYTNGVQALTILGGTCTTQPIMNVNVSGNVVVSTASVNTAGSCTVTPPNPAATSGGGGTSATLNVLYSAQPVSNIQPTITTNYIIKVTPDANSATASGVTSLGGMTGSISCGNLLCSGNTITLNGTAPINVSAGVVSLLNWHNGNTVNVASCGATGDGVTDDAPAIRTCAAQVAANTLGGTLQFSCNSTYLLGSRISGTSGPILQPYSNVAFVGCGQSSVLKVANNMNTVTNSFHVIYPTSNATVIDNATFRNFKIDYNGTNNSCGGTCYYNNIGIGIANGSNMTIDGVWFANNPGSQDITLNGLNAIGVINGASIRNTLHTDACDIVNAACTDHSSIFVAANDYSISNNTCRNSSQSSKSTCWEQWGDNGVAIGNVVDKYNKMANIAAIINGGSTRYQTTIGNTGNNLKEGVTLWCDGASSSVLTDVKVDGNSFTQSGAPTSAAFHDWSTQIGTSTCASNLTYSNNDYKSTVAGGTAGTAGALSIGRGANYVIANNRFSGGLGPAIINGTLSANTSALITDNSITDVGQTSTAGSRRGILIGSAVTVQRFVVSRNMLQNIASTYMTTGIDISNGAGGNFTANSGWVAPDNITLGIATATNLLLAGMITTTPAGVLYAQGNGQPFTSTAAMTNGQLLVGQTGAAPLPKTISGDASVAASGALTLTLQPGLVTYRAPSVNFNSANTDTSITLTAPSGFSRYQILRAYISHCSATATTATVGLFQSAAGAGTAIVAGATAVTVSTASEATANNTQSLTIAAGSSGSTTSLNYSPVFFRVQTPQGSAVTCDVTLQVQWIS